ncbi:putative fatty acyl-CoA reductase, partial [Fragariocoptes setiger]
MPESNIDISPINNFFKGKSIFITGATGFIGKVLLEKLLRLYGQQIRRIFILCRPKRNKSPLQRIHEDILNEPIFEKIKDINKKQCSNLFDKIHIISGDVSEENLGMSMEDWHRLVNDPVSVVFHSAATVKFDEPLKRALTLNLVATHNIIRLCRNLGPSLASLVHVSTAYVNCDHTEASVPIKETIYPLRENPAKLIELTKWMDESTMQTLRDALLDKRPNTYTYSKAMAEKLIAEEASDLPVAIVRPSIVIAAWREPIRGWVDNLNGPTGLLLAIGKGLLRTMQVDRKNRADIVPVDVVVNTMISVAWKTAQTYQINKCIGYGLSESIKSLESVDTQKDDSLVGHETRNIVKIYHCTTSRMNPITWGNMEDLFFPVIRMYPSCQILRYPYGSFKRSYYHDMVTKFFVHILAAYLMDLILWLSGKKPIVRYIYKRLHQAVRSLKYFTNYSFDFDDTNLKELIKSMNHADAKDLQIDITGLNWHSFWHDYTLGARRFVLKEGHNTLPEARQCLKK